MPIALLLQASSRRQITRLSPSHPRQPFLTRWTSSTPIQTTRAKDQLVKSATFTYGDANTDTQDGAQLAFTDWSGNSDRSAANTYSTTFTANPIAASQSTAYFLGNAARPSPLQQPMHQQQLMLSPMAVTSP